VKPSEFFGASHYQINGFLWQSSMSALKAQAQGFIIL